MGVIEHWCQMRGYSKSTLLAQEGCRKPCQISEPSAPDTDGPAIRRSACCKTRLTYEHVDVSSVAVDQAAPVAAPAALLPPPPRFAFLVAAGVPQHVAAPAPPMADDPPHRSGRCRLISLCSWLI